MRFSVAHSCRESKQHQAARAGFARQLVSAGIRLSQLRHILLTHQHSDHNADYGNLILLAWTAGLKTDLLVHDALYPAGVDRLVAGVPNASLLRQSILSHHTSAEDAGRVAKAAGVRTLVLSHLVPPDDPAITDRMWIDAARTHFDGRIIVGKDLLEV